MQTGQILACMISVFSKHTENLAFRHAIVNFDKYGCLIQYPSDTEKKKNQYMLKRENRLTHLSLDTHGEVDGLCFNLLGKELV